MAKLLRDSKRKYVRETSIREVVGKYKGKPLLMYVLPSNEIMFRIKGTRQTFTMHVAHAFTTAKIIEAKARHQKALEDYQQSRKFGGRKRKPKKFFMPYASSYVKSILG